MAYSINPPAHLVATAAGRKFAVWVTVGLLGTQVCLFEYTAEGWIALHSTEPMQDADLRADVAKFGGLMSWLTTLAGIINAKLRSAISGVIAPSTGTSMTDQIQNELNANWKLSLGPDGIPVFGPK